MGRCSPLWLSLLALAAFALGFPANATDNVPPGVVNIVTDLGAVGDGMADDTEPLQKAFYMRKPVYIPEGTYRFTDSIRVRNRAKIYGFSGGWNPKFQSTLLYDGPKGQRAVVAKNAHFAQIRRITINGNEKASIGIYWEYSGNEALLEDVAIIRTLEHGLYVTKTWYASFVRLLCRNNLGAGCTITRDVGAVNDVDFINCRFSRNGETGEYTDENFRTGYGFGSFNAGSGINIIGCSMENNYGAGLLIDGWAVNFLVQGCYIEMNGRAAYERDIELHGEDAWAKPDRQFTGRRAGIIENCQGSQHGIVFDNVYMHHANGIWLRGSGTGHPIQFRNVHGPKHIYSEHGNWVWENSSPITITRLPMIYHRTEAPHVREWLPTSEIPSGHPARLIDFGRTKLMPMAEDGLNLYVNTEAGDDSNDGRSPGHAWASLQKAAKLLEGISLDGQVTIHFAGSGAEPTTFRNIEGTGRVEISCSAEAQVPQIDLKGINCRAAIRGDSTDAVQVRADLCKSVLIEGLNFKEPPRDAASIEAYGASSVQARDCEFANPDAATQAVDNSVIDVAEIDADVR